MRNTLLAFASAFALLVLLAWGARLVSLGGRESTAPVVSPPDKPTPLDAAELTARARLNLARDPSAALADIAHADRLAGPHDEARRALEIVALVRVGRVGHARALSEAFYRAYPRSAQIAQLEQLTGSHPRPDGP